MYACVVLKMAMPQKLLDITNIHALLQKMGGAGTPERMGRYGLLYPGVDPIFPKEGPDGARRYGAAGIEQEQASFSRSFLYRMRPDLFQDIPEDA